MKIVLLMYPKCDRMTQIWPLKYNEQEGLHSACASQEGSGVLRGRAQSPQAHEQRAGHQDLGCATEISMSVEDLPGC